MKLLDFRSLNFLSKTDSRGPDSGFALAGKSLAELMGPLSAADDALARLDERLRASPVRAGVLARADAAEACAALWPQLMKRPSGTHKQT